MESYCEVILQLSKRGLEDFERHVLCEQLISLREKLNGRLKRQAAICHRQRPVDLIVSILIISSNIFLQSLDATRQKYSTAVQFSEIVFAVDEVRRDDAVR